MRLNKFISDNSELSRRKADIAIENGRVKINGEKAILGDNVTPEDNVTLDGVKISKSDAKQVTLLLHKPANYVCSKNGQGSATVYDLLPEKYHGLNIAGRLDKDSSGLVVLTNNGVLLNELTHPSAQKEKVYMVTLDKLLWPEDATMLRKGVDIGDSRLSSFKRLKKQYPMVYEVTLEEGRNRQIRRSFEVLGYHVTKLQREQLGRFRLGKIPPKEFVVL